VPESELFKHLEEDRRRASTGASATPGAASRRARTARRRRICGTATPRAPVSGTGACATATASGGGSGR